MTTPPESPRHLIADHFRRAGATSFADFVVGADAATPMPCWGAIFEQFLAEHEPGDQRAAALNPLLQAGDRRPLFLLLHVSRTDVGLRAALVDSATDLPASVQRALVAIVGADGGLDAAQLDPMAAALLQSEDGRRKELQQFEARIAELLAFRWFVPEPEPAPGQSAARSP